MADTMKNSLMKVGTAHTTPLCRPWDREDLMRRLTTFKSMTWFGKPKVVSAVNCARRGWVNVDADTIACESCGSRIFFSTPVTWTHHQVEKAASVFSLKLDNGHKLLCPWIDNVCEESLAQFPPKPAHTLVNDYKKRLSTLMNLSALPVISSSAISYLGCSQLEAFLKASPVEGSCNGSSDTSPEELPENELEFGLYYQALKLISLCGWELRPLPYTVDCKNLQLESSKNVSVSGTSLLVSTAHSSNSIFSASHGSENKEENEAMVASGGEQCHPNSSVLECKLCGASVGLWAFSTVLRPLELLRVVGDTDVSFQQISSHTGTVSGTHSLGIITNAKGSQYAMNIASTSASSERLPISKSTIAGGPPPAEQKFKAMISLPIVGRSLRARISSDLEYTSVKKSSEGDKDPGSITLTEQCVQPQVSHDKGHDDATRNYLPSSSNNDINGQELVGSKEQESTVSTSFQMGDLSPSTRDVDISGKNGEAIENDALVASETISQEKCFLTSSNCSRQVCDMTGVGAEVQPITTDALQQKEKNVQKLPLYNSMEFDPIRQHKCFCPWMASSGTAVPGWRQTLSVLERLKSPGAQSTKSTSHSIIEVDDPVTSVRKLFNSPSPKRMKLAHDSSSS
ncbi:uncharacterized protein LOC124925782 [Impatiens glandulifera]|uniref:uncharacterized protein LOC124925782 n=1 Tax=Impatiens glandulifera TaxID=253017 RepID=UPI001FB0F823|nr:uncharacterized protein LOC124925782 [Impatiens glandulifera]XP_047321833.1 uncharacterized protein LOC124925782 [Impatiens glandulifera]